MCRRALFLVFLFICYVKVESKGKIPTTIRLPASTLRPTTSQLITTRPGAKYWISPDKRNWNSALARCKELGGNLPSIHSNQENADFRALIAGENDNFWIGLNDIKSEGNFTWSDDSVFDYTNWTNGEPNNSGDCGHIWNYKKLWDDTSCLARFRYICHLQVNGGWAHWSDWSGWAKGLCAGNQRVRTRPCTNPVPSSNGEYCVGDNAENQPGAVDGGWTDWSQWSTCAQPCGGSRVNRTRTCHNPTPAHIGTQCSGHNAEFKLECLRECPDGRVDGKWSPWGAWTPCLKKCTTSGGQNITRTRQCNMPPPMNGGSTCQGPSVEKITACFNTCPRHGGFGSWSAYTSCSTTCGSGVQVRQRHCNNPEPVGSGANNCTGSFTQSKYCKLKDCYGAVNGNWAAFGSWSQCSEATYCLKGEMKRLRTCTNPAPSSGGNDCQGTNAEVKVCPRTNCADLRPTPAPVVPAANGSYIARECDATQKYNAAGFHGNKVPVEVYNLLQFKLSNFQTGYFNFKTEENGEITKFCFEPFPAISIKDVTDNLIQSYTKTDPILGYKKPADNTQPILGFSIRINKDKTLKGYDFGLEFADFFSPGLNVELSNVMFTYYTEGSYFSFLAKGDYDSFAPTKFKTVIFKNRTRSGNGPITSMLGKADEMKFIHFFTALGISEPPSYVVSALKAIKLWDFKFGPCTIAFDFKTDWQVRIAPFRFSATKYVDGIPLHLETILISHKADMQMAFGFVFDGESFGAVVEKMSGNSGGAGGFLDDIGIQVEVGIMLNPFDTIMTTNGITSFTKEPLKSLTKRKIEDGLIIAAQVSIPKDCKSSSFCKITKKIIGPKATFRIQGHIKKQFYKLTAGFYKVKLTENYYFQKLEMYIEANTNKSTTTVGFKAEVKIILDQGEVMVDGMAMAKPELRLGGVIKHKLGTSDIEGQLYMRGMWRKAFGVDWFAIGNINIGITITIGAPTGVTGFQFGGQLEFGKNCLYDADYSKDGHCLFIKIYFGYGKPSYFYGEINALTIGKLVRMFGGKASSVPGIVAESGFPTGLLVSYSVEKDIDLQGQGGPLIRQGTEFKGRLNLLGYEIYVHVRYAPTEIYIEGEMDPINLGGFVKVSRNKTNTDDGPRFFFHYRPKELFLLHMPYVKIYFEGYANVFGIEAYAFINITMDSLEIYIWGKAWNLIYAELYVQSSGYSISRIKDMHFYVRVIVDLRGLTNAIESARKAVDGAFKSAQKTLNGAINKVKAAKRRCKEIMQLKCSNCYSLKCKEAENNCKGWMDKAGKWIGGVINAAGKWIRKTARKIKDGLAYVGRQIKKFFSGWRKRRSLINSRNENFDLHVRNRRFISKLICEGLVGGGCRGVSHLCYGSCEAVNFIGQGLCNILDVAVGALRLAEKACGWINAAIQFLMQLFLIHGIRFELGLGHRFGGDFMMAAEIDMTLFAQRFQLGFSFDLQSPFKSITSAKDSGLYEYKEGVKQQRTGTVYDPYDPPNPFSDFDLSGGFGIESSQTGDGLRLGSCMAAVNKKTGSKVILTGCNQTDARQQWTFSLKGYLVNAYSSKCLDLSDTDGAFVVQKPCKENDNGQKIECDVVTRTLKRRRSLKCVTAAKSSPSGPGSLVHLGSLKCIQVDPKNNLVLRGAGCQTVTTEFRINAAGHLIHNHTGYCVRPKGGGRVSNGGAIELWNSGCHKFAFTQKGSLQHKSSRYCLQTSGNEMKPRNYAPIVLGERCEHIKNGSTEAFPDPQMVFSFVPTDQYLKMKDCKYFDDAKQEQRFEVMNEELASICSKRAHDVALHKSASQSSTNYNGFANRAVDGNYKFLWKDKSCTHTNNETNPWWRVDLGKEYIVTDVTIINRGDRNLGKRLKNIGVHIGNLDDNRRNPICHDLVKQADDGEAVRLQCNPPIPGRYVAVQMYGKGILTLCEVIVNSRVGGLADWCQLENGGCAQICYNKCGKKTTCGCLPGYKLAYDGKACIDINECQYNRGGCRADKHAHCINYPGGYYCGCTARYILKDNSKTECVDFNECGVKNGGCEQMCNNTDGGYLCECRKGFERKKNNPYGCQDTNECLTKNGGCQQKCTNYVGGYYCKCNPGFRLADDLQSCEEIYCNVLEKSHWGAISPSLCVTRYANIPVGTLCTFNCSKGYEIAVSKTTDTLTCRIDGTWNHGSPSCHPVKCPTLTRPTNGGIVPANCHVGSREYGQRCVSYCKHGYRLRGSATRYCRADKQWSADSNVQCIEVIEPPYLNCPGDIMVTLLAHKGGMELGSKFPEPQTNMNITSVSCNANYVFPAGTTIVQFTAVNEKGVTKTCDVLIDVKDTTKPTVTNCPSDILQRTSKLAKIITWTEPTFTDNVGIHRLEKAHIPPGQPWTPGESVMLQYRALDKAGNQIKCTFRVTLKSKHCPPLTGDKYTTIYEFSKGKYYLIGCQWRSKRTLFGPYGTTGGTAACNNGDYTLNANIIGHEAPHCVLQTASTKSATCASGTQKFESTDWFGGKSYYCANCPPGTGFNGVTGTCIPCPIGSYQDEEGQIECEICNKTQSTLKTGSESEQECIDKCAAGYFSSSGLHEPKTPCKICPKGTYNYIIGGTECAVCPSGTSTISTGATDRSKCLSKPVITDYEPKAKKNVKVAETVVFECYYSGKPAPTATWEKVSEGTTTGIVTDMYNMEFEKVGVAFAIFGATTEDTGTYECSVTNKMGRDAKRVELAVN